MIFSRGLATKLNAPAARGREERDGDGLFDLAAKLRATCSRGAHQNVRATGTRVKPAENTTKATRLKQLLIAGRARRVTRRLLSGPFCLSRPAEARSPDVFVRFVSAVNLTGNETTS